MNKTNLVTIMILTVLTGSCLLQALNPFYKVENVRFSDALIGAWTADDSTRWTVEPYVRDNVFSVQDTSGSAYMITCKEKDRQAIVFLARLFVLNGEYFIDFQEKTDSDQFYRSQINAHLLAKVDWDENLMRLKWYNDPWFNSLLKKKKKVKLKYEIIDDNYILTSSTAELQRFILRYGNDPAAFKANYEASTKERENDAFVVTLHRDR